MKHTSFFSYVAALAIVLAAAQSAHAQIGIQTTGSADLNGSSSSIQSTTSFGATVQSDGTVELPLQANSQAEVAIESNDSDTSSDTEVSSTDDSVSVSYNVPVKFLGFLNVTMTEKATVQIVEEGKATVTVTRPWWVIFAKANSNKSDVSSQIEARISSVSVPASVNAKLNASTKAQFVSAIEAAAQASVSSSAEIE